MGNLDAKRYAERKKAGLCKHGCPDPLPGRTYCARHAAGELDYAARDHVSRVDAEVCTYGGCNEPRGETQRCEKHRRMHALSRGLGGRQRRQLAKKGTSGT